MTTTEVDLQKGWERAFGGDPGPDVARFVEKGHGPLPGGAKLLAWDANSVHGYVFDTSNAAAIRGASDLLDKLDQSLRNGTELGLDADQILYAGGGGGMAIVAAEDADKVIRQIHELYARRTLVATCSTDTVEVGPGEVSFQELRGDLLAKLARNRVLWDSGVEVEVPFFAERCAVCGRRAAAIEKNRQNETRLECEVCFHTIEAGKQVRYVEGEAADYEIIADRQKECLGVLYFDGNGIGQRLGDFSSPREFATFSRALHTTLRPLFLKLAKERHQLRDERDEDVEKGRGYQLPICGGDDLVAILPGDVAVPFARDLLASFRDRTAKDPALGELHAAAGVAIGKKGFPIRHLIEEAEALLKSAKKRVYCDQGAKSALDFAKIADGSPRRASIKAERFMAVRPSLLLSGRPYSLHELERFSLRFAAVRQAGLGQSQLYALRRIARQGLGQLRNHVLYQVGRHEEWRHLIGQLAGDPDTGHDTVRNKEAVVDQVAHLYGDDRVLDVADMIELLDHWREPQTETAA